MLSDASVTTMLPVMDMDRARAFYEGCLGLKPGGLHFEAEDDEPLGWMHENRNLRAALQARAEAGRNSWLLWKSRVANVERSDHGVVVAMADSLPVNLLRMAVAAVVKNLRSIRKNCLVA